MRGELANFWQNKLEIDSVDCKFLENVVVTISCCFYQLRLGRVRGYNLIYILKYFFFFAIFNVCKINTSFLWFYDLTNPNDVSYFFCLFVLIELIAEYKWFIVTNVFASYDSHLGCNCYMSTRSPEKLINQCSKYIQL